MTNYTDLDKEIITARRAKPQRRPMLCAVLVAMTASFGLTVFSSNAADAAPPIYVNNELIDVPAVVRDNQVFVPVRGVFEKLNTAVDYTPPNNVVARKAHVDLAQLSLGSRHAKVDGSARTLNSAPFLMGSRVFVPLRLISEAAGASVAYSVAPHAVRITEVRPVVAVAPASLASPQAAPVAQHQSIPWWIWLLLGLIVLALLFVLLRRRKPEPVIRTRSSVSNSNIKTRP